MPRVATKKGVWLRRFGWLVLIWAASVGALAVIAIFFRLFMKTAGMTV